MNCFSFIQVSLLLLCSLCESKNNDCKKCKLNYEVVLGTSFFGQEALKSNKKSEFWGKSKVGSTYVC